MAEAPSAPTPEATPAPALAPTPANAAPSLLSTPPAPESGTPPQPQQLTPEQQAAADKSAAESKVRVEAWQGAATPEGKKAAYEALNPDEKKGAYDKLSGEDRKALAIEDPTLPVYEVDKFKAPEGATLDVEGLKPVLEVFKEMRIPQEGAQKLIDIAVGRELAAANKGVQQFVDLQTKWVSEIKADPDIGGDKFQASIASAARAIDRLAIPGLREALDLTGAGNNPAVVKAFVRLGQMVSEDRFAPGNGALPAASKSPAERIYGDDPNKVSA